MSGLRTAGTTRWRQVTKLETTTRGGPPSGCNVVTVSRGTGLGRGQQHAGAVSASGLKPEREHLTRADNLVLDTFLDRRAGRSDGDPSEHAGQVEKLLADCAHDDNVNLTPLIAKQPPPADFYKSPPTSASSPRSVRQTTSRGGTHGHRSGDRGSVGCCMPSPRRSHVEGWMSSPRSKRRRAGQRSLVTESGGGR